MWLQYGEIDSKDNDIFSGNINIRDKTQSLFCTHFFSNAVFFCHHSEQRDFLTVMIKWIHVAETFDWQHDCVHLFIRFNLVKYGELTHFTDKDGCYYLLGWLGCAKHKPSTWLSSQQCLCWCQSRKPVPNEGLKDLGQAGIQASTSLVAYDSFRFRSVHRKLWFCLEILRYFLKYFIFILLKDF